MQSFNLINGNIITLNDNEPIVNSLSVGKGKIISLNKTISKLKTIDLNRATVIPGFIDAHFHLKNYGKRLDQVDLKGLRSLDEIQCVLENKLQSIDDGQCMGRVYDQRRSGTKYIKNGCKFPLGFWKKGETRSFSVTDSGRSRTVELKILSLGKKPTSCVKYNWKMFDATNGKKLADNDYKFCNKKAMTSLLIRKIKD
tara:strand:- start:503 stop:1096 length:594 start_codon:yes stop_codon:yes gene_type:complete